MHTTWKLRRLDSADRVAWRAIQLRVVELQERTEELQQRNEALERNVADVLTENRHLKEPLAHANNEVAEMRAKTDDYDNMKSILQVRSIVIVFCLFFFLYKRPFC